MINLKTAQEVELMAEGGKILAGIMNEVAKAAKPGATTKYLNKVAEDLVLKSGGKCSFLNYKGFPACLCTSINEEVVHCIPSERIIKEGDVLCLDLGIFYKGFHSDMAVTVPVGKVSREAARLIKTTQRALERGIKKVKIGNTFGDIGNAVQRYVESRGFNVVREMCGHGIGRNVHEDPEILNFGQKKTGPEIKEGMVFCIEPMATTGDWHLVKARDQYGYQTKDKSLAAHFEHTIAVTKNKVRVLTNYPQY